MKNIKWHILGWALYFIVVYRIDSFVDPRLTIVEDLIILITQNVFLFYGLLYLLVKFSVESIHTFLFSIGRVLIFFSTFFVIRYFVRYYFMASLFDKEYNEMPWNIWLASSVVAIINSSFYSLAYFYFRTSIAKEKRIFSTEKDILVNQKERYRLEKEKIQLENTLLRAQINPHFLFNTLGYFYNEISELHPQVGEGITALADIMRSAIRKPDADGLIALEEEIYNVEQLIGIYKLRYNERVFIYFSQEGESNEVRILPHILTTLVENGLKHGEIHSSDYPFSIALTIADDTLLFKTHNKKRIGPKELSHGIGMKFLRNHLDTVYENCYSLSIEEDDTFYTAILNVEIKDRSIIEMIS